MKKSSVKWLCIILLLLLNAVFAASLAIGRSGSAKLSAEELADTAGYLSRCGITLADGAIPASQAALGALEYARSEQREAEIASALLGRDTSETHGGGISVYSSPLGEATFRRGSAVSMSLPAQAIPQTPEEAEKAAAKLLASAGLDVPDGANIVGRSEGEVYIKYVGRCGGRDVAGAELTVFFRTDGTAISGILLVGKPTASGSERSRSLTTLAADFAAHCVETGLAVTSVTSVRAVYAHTVADDGSSRLIPAAEIETDAGTYLVNGFDGALIS